jgi:hypothetical protein
MRKSILWLITGILLFLPIGAMAVVVNENSQIPITEPATLLMMGCGVIGLRVLRKSLK